MTGSDICTHCKRTLPLIPGFDLLDVAVVNHVDLACFPCDDTMSIVVGMLYSDGVWEDDDLWTEIVDDRGDWYG
jgi:hypothetical protein